MGEADTGQLAELYAVTFNQKWCSGTLDKTNGIKIISSLFEQTTRSLFYGSSE